MVKANLVLLLMQTYIDIIAHNFIYKVIIIG